MTTDTSLRQMPILTADYDAKAETTSGRLRGDPSLPLDAEPEEPPADEDGQVDLSAISIRSEKEVTYSTRCITPYECSLRGWVARVIQWRHPKRPSGVCYDCLSRTLSAAILARYSNGGDFVGHHSQSPICARLDMYSK